MSSATERAHTHTHTNTRAYTHTVTHTHGRTHGHTHAHTHNLCSDKVNKHVHTSCKLRGMLKIEALPVIWKMQSQLKQHVQ